jgi:hypothetical protein
LRAVFLRKTDRHRGGDDRHDDAGVEPFAGNARRHCREHKEEQERAPKLPPENRERRTILFLVKFVGPIALQAPRGVFLLEARRTGLQAAEQFRRVDRPEGSRRKAGLPDFRRLASTGPDFADVATSRR